MIDIENIFKFKKANREKLCENGFTCDADTCCKDFEIVHAQFIMRVNITSKNEVTFRVTDVDYGDEYTLLNAEGAVGSFVSQVRKECETILNDIASSCFDTEMLKAEQSKRLSAYISERFGVLPEFLWDKSPDFAVFRRRDNNKWFAIIMNIEKEKLGSIGHGKIEIVNLRADSETVTMLLEKKGFFPAYHMNKKYWYTVCLDGTVSDDELFELVSLSLKSVGGKNNKK